MELANIQTDSETLEKLREVAKANERSMAAQLRWMVAREWEKTFPQPISISEDLERA